MHKSVFFIEQDAIDAFLQEWHASENTIALLTSGSTGSKKVIHAEKKFLEASVLMTGQFFNFTENTTALHCLPMTFIAGKMMLLRIVAFQMKAFFCSPSDPLLFPDDVEIDFAAMTPFQYQKCLDTHATKLCKIKTVLLGGAPISPALEQKIAALPHRVFHSYGMTETYSHIALREVGKEELFEALPEVHFSTNPKGALVIHAPKLGQAHLETQDLVELIDEHHFRFLGRLDFVVNSGGIKLHPEALERKISSLLPKTNYFFAGIPDALLGEKLVLFVESEKALSTEKLGALLSKFERPKQIIYCDQFCYTDTGKLHRPNTIKTYMH